MGKTYDVKPSNYSLEFNVDLAKGKFAGKERVTVNVKKPLNSIVLNASELKVSKASVSFNEKTLKATAKLNQEKEELTISFKEKIKGDAFIDLEFTGKISKDLAAFYESVYEVNGKKRKMATTDFEPADARRLLPCFDEPAQKASFDVSVVIDSNLTAVGNMPVSMEGKIGKKKKVTFQTTPVMSTYLLYLGIGEFEFLEGKMDNTLIRIVTTPGKKETGKFALECTQKFLKYYNEYFGIPYPLPKLDLLAIPDFKSGAMENWGAITFRERALLFDEKSGSKETKQVIAEIIAHELTHQWFGDLVTMQWWNDLWLNESFASFMAYKLVDKFFPEWRMMDQFLEDEMIGAFSLDALHSSHPIEVTVNEPKELSEIFDAISYNKGGSVLRMLEDYLGEETFRKGLHEYLSKHAYSNAVTNDLWDALETASNIQVRKMMNTWTSKMGYPLVTASLKGNSLELKQDRFVLEKKGKGGDTWFIPMKALVDGEKKHFLLTQELQHIPLRSVVKLNYGQTGFYKVRYSKELWTELRPFMSKMSVGDRWGLQADAFSVTKNCSEPFQHYLNFIQAYGNEEECLVASDILGKLVSVYLQLPEGKLKETTRSVLEKHAERLHRKLGWNAVKREDELDSFLRTTTLSVLGGVLKKENIVAEAGKRFAAFLKNRDSLHPDLRRVVFGIVAKNGGTADYALFKKLYEKEKNPEEKLRFLGALSRFSQKELLKKTLDYILSKQVRSQESFVLFSAVAGNRDAEELLWPWIKKNWDELHKRFGKGDNVKILAYFVSGLSGLSDLKTEREIKAFFTGKDTKGFENKLAQTTEWIRINHAFIKFNS